MPDLIVRNVPTLDSGDLSFSRLIDFLLFIGVEYTG
jgi:hypothetical protein